MKTLYDILNKKYNHKLIDHKVYKKKWKKLYEHLEQCGVNVSITQDIDCFQYEIIEQSIQIKERFEEVFFATYVTMHDYWYDLNYQERKKQMNVDIDKLKETLTKFSYEGQEIYMPCFSLKFNHLYTDEIVLLDLKQYHKFIRTYATQICKDEYGVLPYLRDFSSAHVLCYKDSSFVLYHELSTRLYLFIDNQFIRAFSLDCKRIGEEIDILYTLAKQLLNEDEDALVDTLLKTDLLSKQMHKKILKYKHKKLKRINKQKKKEHKKEPQE